MNKIEVKPQKLERERLIDELLGRFGIDSGFRNAFSKKESWYLTKYERLLVRIVRTYVDTAKSCTIDELYNHEELKVLIPNNNTRRYAIKYVLMYLKASRAVRVRCNNGLKVIQSNA